MSLSMEDWDKEVGHHLQMIEAGAEMCQRHADRLMGMPEWKTKALEQVDEAGTTLMRSMLMLAKVKTAMLRKPHVS